MPKNIKAQLVYLILNYVKLLLVVGILMQWEGYIIHMPIMGGKV